MRFDKVQKFGIDELLLDQGNYRFNAAIDQKGCIVKIHSSNPQYFKNLMSSVAEDNLGELLLVFQNGKENIVLDGNRRLATLKVLHDPDKYGPSESIKEHARTLGQLNKIDFQDIQAQVSSDKQLIYKTVYERHAAGQGKARIGWSAYGAARFRYDQQLGDTDEWRSIALLLATEYKHPEWTDFIDSSEYSHEVFRRIFRAAEEKGIISASIFSVRNQRIKSTADKKLLKDAISKVIRFLESMKVKDLSLSRNGKYADKISVDTYLSQFSLSPDNIRTQPPEDASSEESETDNKEQNTDADESDNSSEQEGNNTGTQDTGNQSGNSDQSSTNGAGTSSSKEKQGYGIDYSEALANKLNSLNAAKFINLYRSLCTVSLTQHPILLYVGAWSFFESLSSFIGKPDGTSFDSYIGSIMNNNLNYAKNQKRDFNKPLKDISETGNINKHSGSYHSNQALQLRTDFITLEPLIINLIDWHLKKKNP